MRGPKESASASAAWLAALLQGCLGALRCGVTEPGLRQRVGGLGRGEAFRARLAEDRMEGVGDLPEQPFGLGPVVAFAAALEADQDVHDPAGVVDVVRRVENAALLEAPGVGRVFQLIVGAAGDRATAQL